MTTGCVGACLHVARRLLAALMCVMASGAVRCADNVDVSAHAANGAGVEVHARATLSATHELIWQTLTDYDQLASFIPGMHKSRVVQWRGHTALVEQEGVAHFLLFSVPISVTVERCTSRRASSPCGWSRAISGSSKAATASTGSPSARSASCCAGRA